MGCVSLQEEQGRCTVSSKTPIEHRCLACFNFWKDNLAHLMDWDALCGRLNDKPETRGEMQTAVEAKQGDGNPDRFSKSDVVNRMCVGIEIFEEGLFLSATDFKEVTGYTPQEAKVSAVSGRGKDGEYSSGYPMKDQSQPYRRFRSGCFIGEAKDTYLLHHDRQVMAAQADWAVAKAKAQRKDEKGGAKNLSTMKLFTVEECKARGEESRLAHVEQQYQDDQRGGADSEGEDDEVEEITRFGTPGEDAMDSRTPKKLGKSVGASSAGGECDDRSGFGGSVWDEEHGEEKEGGRRASCDHWIHKLDLNVIMLGVKKFGREQGFAEGALARYLERSL